MHLTNFSFEFFYEIFTEDASQRLLYHGAKKSKMTKNSNQGGSCLKIWFSFFDQKKDGAARNSIVCFGASIPCHAIWQRKNEGCQFYEECDLFRRFLMTMSLTTCPVSVHTATSRTLRNSSAIRLLRPRTSLFLSSPLYLSLILPATLLLQASEQNFCLSLLLPSI